MKLFKEVFNLFYPKLCVTCENHLVQSEKYLCSSCLYELPETGFFTIRNNLLEQSLKGRVPIVKAAALFYYRKNGKVKELIHSLKYKNRQELGDFFAKWIGLKLIESKFSESIDGIIMVPLHAKRYKERGYNQLSVFAKQLSKELKIPVFNKVLIKVGQSSSQTKKGRYSRFEKLDERFHISDTNILKDKHILLIDDVFTTGATIEACANEISKTSNVRISVVTMAISDPY